MSPTSIWDCLQSAENLYSIGVGSTETCLEHGQAIESQNVGCRPDHLFCSWVDEVSDDVYKTSTLQPWQRLVEQSRQALVHEDRPIADSCLGEHSRFVSCDQDRLTWGEVAQAMGQDPSFSFPAILMGVCALPAERG